MCIFLFFQIHLSHTVSIYLSIYLSILMCSYTYILECSYLSTHFHSLKNKKGTCELRMKVISRIRLLLDFSNKSSLCFSFFSFFFQSEVDITNFHRSIIHQYIYQYFSDSHHLFKVDHSVDVKIYSLYLNTSLDGIYLE